MFRQTEIFVADELVVDCVILFHKISDEIGCAVLSLLLGGFGLDYLHVFIEFVFRFLESGNRRPSSAIHATSSSQASNRLEEFSLLNLFIDLLEIYYLRRF